MIPKQIIARSMMFACVLLSACGHSGEENPQPGKPEPEKPVEEENYPTVIIPYIFAVFILFEFIYK